MLADRLARHGLGALVQDARLLQPLHDQRDAAGRVQVRGDEPAARLEVAQQRRALADPVEIVDVEVDADLLGDREQVEHAVGRAAAARDRGDRVLEAVAGDDVAGCLAASEDIHDEAAGLLGNVDLVRVFGRNPRGKRRDPEHLERHRHRVGGELAATRAVAGRRSLLDRGQLLVGDPAGSVRADRLEHLLDGDALTVVVPGVDRAAVEHQARQVQAGQRHHGGGDRLVAGTDRDHRIERLSEGDQLDRVGNHLAADQRRLHPLGAHRDPVRDRDRVELHRRPAGLADPLLDLGAERPEVEVAWHRLDPGVGDADQRLAQRLIVVADALQLGAGGGALGALGERAALVLEVHGARNVSRWRSSEPGRESVRRATLSRAGSFYAARSRSPGSAEAVPPGPAMSRMRARSHCESRHRSRRT